MRSIEKKLYAKPFMVVEEFVPQNYCGTCDTLLTNLHNYGIYLDWNPNGTYGYFDKGTEFMNTYGSMTGATDGVYKNVAVYHLKRSPYKSGDLSEYSNEFPQAHEYTTSIFTLNGNETPRYQFVKFSKTYDIKIKNKKVYYNMS